MRKKLWVITKTKTEADKIIKKVKKSGDNSVAKKLQTLKSDPKKLKLFLEKLKKQI